MDAERILVVEDERAVRELLRLLLEDNGYQVVEAEDGREGVERCRREALSLVILDLRMPVMSGFDACRVIRNESDVPIIMLSAMSDSHDIVVARRPRRVPDPPRERSGVCHRPRNEQRRPAPRRRLGRRSRPLGR